MNEYDTVQYTIPTSSGITFHFSPEDRDSSITVLDGAIYVATLDPDVQETRYLYLPPMLEVKISSLKLSILSLCAAAPFTKVKLAVRGNHYVTDAYIKIDNIKNTLFYVTMRVDSFLFILNSKLVTLQIFTGDESSRVVIKAIDGSPGIMGSPLAQNKKYHLLPHSCVTVSSLNDRPCTVEVEGRNRMIRLSFLKVNENLNAVETVFNRLHELCISSMNKKCIGPIVLVIGPPNVGKTSLCHFLLNNAIDKGMNPIYIDLDIRKNSITLPGSISLSEIKSHLHITKLFKNHEQLILQFGSLNVNHNNEQFYHYLIRKMGQHLKKCLLNNVTSYSDVIIDMYGPLGQNEPTVSCVLNSFDISRVLVVGDKSYYESMKNRLVDKAIEFIPQPENIEPKNEILETKFLNMILRKYFYGKIRIPEEPDTVEVKLSEVKLYIIVRNFVSSSSTTVNSDNFRLEPVSWGPFIEYCVLGVSKETDINEFPSAFEVKHFVCFTKIDLAKGVGILLSPETDPFSGKCFIMGEVKMVLD